MTFVTTSNKVSYNGDDSTTIFAIAFLFYSNSDITAILRDANGVETTWVETTDYTLTGAGSGSGTLTATVAPATGETLTIKRMNPETQAAVLPTGGPLPAKTIEQMVDLAVMNVQAHSEEISRAPLLPPTASLSSLTMPEPGAGELLRYNAGGTDLETVTVGDINTAIDTILTAIATNDFLRWDGGQSAFVNITPGATGLAVFQDTTAAAARTTLELVKGVASGNVPAMDATGYPVADGSQITQVSVGRGFIDGLILSNNATDAIDVAAGEARDGGNAANMVLAAALTNKQLNVAWAVGSAAGMLDTGAQAASTWYHIWLIRRSDTGVVDVLASLSATAPTFPANYDQKRRIGAVLTDATPDIVGFKQFGDEFTWVTVVAEYVQSNPGTAAVLRTLTVPTGLSVLAVHHAALRIIAAAQAYMLVTSIDQTDSVPSVSLHNVGGAGDQTYDGHRFEIKTDINGQIRTRLDASSTSRIVHGNTNGWIDPRGRNG